jgi:ribosomal protein S18 acetylase RimI-like enzyme
VRVVSVALLTRPPHVWFNAMDDPGRLAVDQVRILSSGHGRRRDEQASDAELRTCACGRTLRGRVRHRDDLPGRRVRARHYAGACDWDLVVLASVDDEPIGMAATTFSSWNRLQVLNELHVTPPWRRQGAERRLVAAAFEDGGHNQARDVCLETQNVNVPAIHAYRRLGFRVTGIDATFYDGPANAEVAIFMSAPLRA